MAIIYSVALETRKFIEDLLKIKTNMKPNEIIRNIELENINRVKPLPTPLKKDLSNFLYTLNIKRIGKSNMTLGKLF